MMRTFLAICGAVALMIPVGLMPSGNSVAEDGYRRGQPQTMRPSSQVRRSSTQPFRLVGPAMPNCCELDVCAVTDCPGCREFCQGRCDQPGCRAQRRRMRRNLTPPRRSDKQSEYRRQADSEPGTSVSPLNSTNKDGRPADRDLSIQWRTDLRLVQRESLETGLPILMKFSASWCGPCIRMKSETFTDRELAGMINTHFIPVEVDTDENPRLVRQLRIDSVPTTLVISPQGEIVDRRTGFQSATQLERSLARYVPQPDDRPLVLHEAPIPLPRDELNR